MAEITIYTKPLFPYCADALDLLEKKGVTFNQIDVSGNAEKRAEMIQRSGGRMTVPQIFVGERHIGGCDDIYALDARGELDPMLAQ
jgi:glutaredoxin 3